MNLKKKKEKKIQDSLDYTKFLSSRPSDGILGEHKEKIINDIKDELSYKKIPNKRINITIE